MRSPESFLPMNRLSGVQTNWWLCVCSFVLSFVRLLFVCLLLLQDDYDEIVGVKVQASFIRKSRSFQLSGGEQTVVALTILFALQRLQPAPLYLFDEIDASLDTKYLLGHAGI